VARRRGTGREPARHRAEAVRVQYQGQDLLLERPVRWTLGMQVDDDGTWGMGGIGGSIGYTDPARNHTFVRRSSSLIALRRRSLT
jgi:CubicO group peptidase (beta-lactamase class C family)